MNVIVTNARNRIAYNVVRSLGRRGIKVYAGDFVPASMSFMSRYAAGHFVYPSPFKDPEGFLSSLTAEIERVRAGVLIPVFEETFLIAKHQARFAPVAFVLPTFEQILTAHNKDAWEPLARRLDIPVPRTYSMDDLRSGALKTGELAYPVLIKPKQGGGAWGIQEFGSPATLDEALGLDSWAGKPWDRFFLQEKILGETHCVAMLFNRGQLRARVVYRQLRDYPATGGQATLRVSIANDKAVELFERLLADLRWHGPCQADFIVDARGTPYLIDINPRLWGSLTQAIASGVDFPHLIYRIATEGDVAPIASFKTGVVTRWLGGDLAALPARLLKADSRFRVLRDFVLPDPRPAMLDDFSFRDPGPFLAWAADAVRRAVRFRSLSAVSHDALDGIWQ